MNDSKTIIFIIFLFVLIFSLSQSIYSFQQLSADEIMELVSKKQVEYQSKKTQAEMRLIDKNDKVEERELLMFEKEEKDKISILLRFLAPKNVAGVTLLSLDNGDKIYLYMPAYQKPRRIAGSAKQENFLGTDFSYEDLGMDYQQTDYKKELKEETKTQFIIEVIPVDKDTSYSKFVLYVHKEQFYLEKVEFYNLEGVHTKTLEIKEIKLDEQEKITPMKVELTNILENHKTIMDIKEIEYDLELPADFFSLRTIQKPKL